jgi:hypothetical protein
MSDLAIVIAANVAAVAAAIVSFEIGELKRRVDALEGKRKADRS